jgi:hypothetical protein
VQLFVRPRGQAYPEAPQAASKGEVMPIELLERIAAWRTLCDDAQVRELRGRVVDEVVGNMRMEGQPVSAAWENRARMNA